MNHVFLFQVHKEPELLDRILTRLDSTNHFYAVNIDKKCNCISEMTNVLKKHNNVIDISMDNIMHGGFSQVNCTIQQMKRLLDSREYNFDYYHTLSGQDYPCVSNNIFDLWFSVNDGTSYCMMDSSEQAAEWRKDKYRLRLERWNWSDIFNTRFAMRLHLNGIMSRLTSIINRRYPDIEKIWGGWNWFSLNEHVVRYIMDYFARNPDYLKRFRYTYCCDELVFSTVLYYKRDELAVETRNSLRYVEWHPNRKFSSLPLILDEREYDDIVNSGAFFCRKVERDFSNRLLDLLDQRIESMGSSLPKQNPKTP